MRTNKIILNKRASNPYIFMHTFEIAHISLHCFQNVLGSIMFNVNVEIINLNPVVEVQFRWDFGIARTQQHFWKIQTISRKTRCVMFPRNLFPGIVNNAGSMFSMLNMVANTVHFTVHLSCHEAVRELVLLVAPESPSSFVICSGRLLNNSKSLTENIGDSDWSKCQPIKLVIVNSHYFSFWTNLSISYGLTSHCPYSTLKHYFTPTQFISRTFGICRSCDPEMLQSGYSYFKCPLCSCLEVLGTFWISGSAFIETEVQA